ncbi:tyrosine-type recombinase/integrase [haloarchaeon 3A1-DGR]|nr:tyrosine-type recombinase/integrase [haloarchaeon 3A1-DGR]
MSATTDREAEFVEEYVESRAYDDDFGGPETLRKNAKKYGTSLFGTNVSRMGWFEWLNEEREKSPEEATTKDIRGFLLYLQEEGLSSPTRTQARSGISLWYQLMGDGENPVSELNGSWRATTNKEDATGEKRNHPTRDEIKALIENVPEPTLRSTLIIKLLYHTGCRRMELATIQTDRIDLENQEIKVYADKTDEWRTVTFRESLRQPLNIWTNGPRTDEPGYHEDNAYLFPSASTRGENDHISGQLVRSTVHKAAQNAGVQDTYGDGDVNGQNQWRITPHALRHAFAVHSAENGVPAPHLKKIMGHTKLDVTQIYADIAEDDAAEMMKQRGPSLRE